MIRRLACFALCAPFALLACGVSERPFQNCQGRAFTPAPAQGWRHTTSTITAALGGPNHSAEDIIGKPGQARSLRAKFTYGSVASKDIQDETVRVWIDDCATWRELGDYATTTDGRIALPVPTQFGPGTYEVRFQVLGDQSTTTSFLSVLPAGTHVIVTDIDGTLTASDSELFAQIVDGTHVPVAYPFAVDLTTAHAARGHVVVYLTGRPYWLTQRTRAWVTNLGFAPGPLHVTDSNEEALPTNAGVGSYKMAWLRGLIDAGYIIDFAYGNAPTDISAYIGAGLPANQIWIIGANAGQMGTHAVADSWEARAADVRALPATTQPFQR